jgi:protein-tyrosine phosphatase
LAGVDLFCEKTMINRTARIALLVSLALLAPAEASAVEAPVVERAASGQVVIRWRGDDPVDVYVATRPDAAITAARRLAHADTAGAYTLAQSDPARPYFLLNDERDGSVTRVAERLLPLDRGSNFRDVGGYPAAGGKHVRWGMIYRTAALPMLTDADYRYVRTLGITSVVDLRSIEERQAVPDQFPTRIGVRYYANDYPASSIFSRIAQPPPTGAAQDPHAAVISLYRTWLVDLAPQFRDIFRQLLRHDGAVSYHCSAGQDRTGVATALVLSALGVPRDVILQDYLLSTADRRPENEMPKLDPAKYPGNLYVTFVAKMQASGQPMTAKPLYDQHGAFLLATFDDIDTRWGGVDGYLDQVLGVDQTDIARLRSIYLE